jgi:hypothetical protein
LNCWKIWFYCRDINNKAMAREVIEFDKPLMLSAPETMTKGDVVQHFLKTGDYYFGVLSSKVRLTKLGLYMLEITEADEEWAMRAGDLPEPVEEAAGPFGEPAPRL